MQLKKGCLNYATIKCTVTDTMTMAVTVMVMITITTPTPTPTPTPITLTKTSPSMMDKFWKTDMERDSKLMFSVGNHVYGVDTYELTSVRLYAMLPTH